MFTKVNLMSQFYIAVSRGNNLLGFGNDHRAAAEAAVRDQTDMEAPLPKVYVEFEVLRVAPRVYQAVTAAHRRFGFAFVPALGKARGGEVYDFASKAVRAIQ